MSCPVSYIMKTKHKCLLAALIAIIAILAVNGSSRRNRRKSYEARFMGAFSQIVEHLSGDSKYIVKSNPHAHWGFSTVSDPNRLDGYIPDNPILIGRDLGPLHVSLAVLFEKKPTLLSRVTSTCGIKLSTGRWIYPDMLAKKEKTIMVAMSNPTISEVQALARKVNALKIDSDIPITYHESRD